MAQTTDPAGEERKERLDALVRIEDKVAEAAEAAADATAHAVEATQAAEAASKARVAKKKATAATTAKAAKAAKTAKSKAGKAAARAAKAASTATAPDALLEPTGPLQTPTRVVKVRLTEDELDQIERLAAEQELPVPALARSLLVRALNRSRDLASPPGEQGKFGENGN